MGRERFFGALENVQGKIKAIASSVPHFFQFRNRSEEERQNEIVRALTSTHTAAGDPEPDDYNIDFLEVRADIFSDALDTPHNHLPVDLNGHIPSNNGNGGTNNNSV